MAQEQAQVKRERKTVHFEGARKYTPSQAAMIAQHNKHIIRHLLACYAIVRGKEIPEMKHKQYDRAYLDTFVQLHLKDVQKTA